MRIRLGHRHNAPGFDIANNDALIVANDEDAFALRIEHYAMGVRLCALPGHDVPPRVNLPNAEAAIRSEQYNATAVTGKHWDGFHVLQSLVCAAKDKIAFCVTPPDLAKARLRIRPNHSLTVG